jgi:hypothetical protein
MWSSKPALGAVLLVLCLPAQAAEDLRALEVVGQRGQSLEQTRRDRYECHNWAVEQTGETPAAVPAEAEPREDRRELRRERIDRAIVGATIGGAVGSILRGGRRDSAERVLAGATAGGENRGEAADAEEQGESDYLRALTACLEGRGYTVALPTAADFAVSR